MKIATSTSFVVTILAALLIAVVDGSPYVISDQRVRSLDITPVLGRGYSIMTDSYQSTCLVVHNTTIPSYNYDYTFHDFTTSTNFQQDVQSKMSYSFGYWWFRGQVDRNYSSSSNTSRKTHYVTSVMRIERYYSSIRDDLTKLQEGAVLLLNRQDYVGFFKACGPTYIRGIRRAQEVTGVFSFTSTSTESARSYSSNLQLSSGWSGWGNFRYGRSAQSNSKFNSETSSLKIKIAGYGLGLSEEGSETLVATSHPEFEQVMIFAFNSMTKSSNSLNIGMVYGMEVVPWADNIEFQVAAGISDEGIEMPLPRSLIPKAFRINDQTDTNFDATNRPLFRCKEPSFSIDRHGYCCEFGALYDYVNEEYDGTDPANRVCKPLRIIDKAMVKDNMISNGEFVARLDRAVRYRLNQMNTLEKCLSAVRNIPERFDFNILKDQDTVNYDGVISGAFTVFELKMALDPFNDYSLLKQYAVEFDEYVDMFYQPCLNALFGANIGTTSDTESSLFMALPWHSHDECTKLSCFTTTMRWNRGEGGGCVPGLITGAAAHGYDWDDSNCSKDTNYGGATERCKYNSEELWAYHQKITHCWKSGLPAGRINYFMDHFCMPEITADTLTDEEAANLLSDHEEFCTGTYPQSNTPSLAPSSVPSGVPSISLEPSGVPTGVPSVSSGPSAIPSIFSSEVPSAKPSEAPSDRPTIDRTA